MNKKELSELKKLFTLKNCTVTRIAGCYVDGEKNRKAEFARSFLALPEEEMFKYFEIFRKALSGTPGKTSLDLSFPMEAEQEGGEQEFMMRLRSSGLKDEALLEEYFNRIITSFEYVGNYLIMVIHDAYDVPGRATDGMDMEDASDEVYEYLLTVICPVNLTDAGLSYDPIENTFHNRVRDWVVELPVNAILFPAFNDRGTDIHSVMFYAKDSENPGVTFAEMLLGCSMPLSAGSQKETFQALVEETLGEACDFEAVKTVHEKMTEMLEEHKEEPDPLVLDRGDVKKLLADSGAPQERLSDFETQYTKTAGESNTGLYASNVFSTRSFDVKTPDVVIKVKPDRTDLITSREVDGRSCIVVELGGDVEVNGITVRPYSPSEREE